MLEIAICICKFFIQIAGTESNPKTSPHVYNFYTFKFNVFTLNNGVPWSGLIVDIINSLIKVDNYDSHMLDGEQKKWDEGFYHD